MNKKKIFLIDDEPAFIEMIKVRLEANNYEVITAFNGKEAMEKIEHDKPNVILLDISMPQMNGYQICERLKQGEKTADIPIILLTNKDLEPHGIVEKCLKLGVDAFMSKLAEAKELLVTIEEVLNK
jgi:CheY-like chemotaxis protein